MTSPTTDRRFGVNGGLAFKAPVALATTANITLSGEQVVDGTLTSASRVLVKNQTTTSENGLYDTSSSSWTRCADANGNRDLVTGTAVYVTGGATQGGAFYAITTANPITVGTSSLTWVVSVAAGSLAAQLASTASALLGPALVGFNPTLNYAAGTIGWSEASRRQWNCADFPWLAKFDGATDDTAAILACMTAIYAAGGGTVVMPGGTAAVTSVVFNFTAARSVNLRGAGEQATYLQKIGATTTPVLNISVDVGVLDVYSTFEDFTVLGNAKAHHGVQATRLASFTTRNLGIRACDVGFESLGCLVTSHYKPDWLLNNIGFRCRKLGAIYPNLVVFEGGAVKTNTTFGLDIGECSGFHLWNTDIESNGTAANAATGGVKIRATVDDETGFSEISFNGAWLEANHGSTFVCDAAGGLHLSLRDVKLASSELGQALSVGAIASVVLENVEAASPGDTVTLAATNSTIVGGTINTLTDTSTNRTHVNVSTSAGVIKHYAKSASIGTGGLMIDQTAYIMGGAAFSEGAVAAAIIDGAVAGNPATFYHNNGAGPNAAAAAAKIGRNSSTGRGVNSGGSLNANGADYAEYEVKRDDCGLITKGDVVGFDAAGLLTDRWSLAVTFGIKSTDPCMVGGDTWFAEQPPAAGPTVEFLARLEAARAKVDRIAYAGKVPVNVVGAQVGDLIAPAEMPGDRIGCTPLSSATPEQYGTALGRVRSMLPDGRPVVVVRPA